MLIFAPALAPALAPTLTLSLTVVLIFAPALAPTLTLSLTVVLIFAGLESKGRRGSRKRLSRSTSCPAVVATSTDFGVSPATVWVTASASTGAPKA